MGRRKIAMELIGNGKARRIAFEKRKESIKKMSHQLSTLCGVDVCAIVYQGPESAAETYPSDRNHVRAILNRYTSIPKEESAKRSLSLSVDSAVKKCSNYPAWVSRLDGCSMDQLSGFLSALDHKLGVVEDRMARAQTQAMLQWRTPEVDIAAPSTSAAMYAAAFGGGGSSMQPFYGGTTGTTLSAFEERMAAFRRTQVQNQAMVQWRPSDVEMGAPSTSTAMYAAADTSSAAFGCGFEPLQIAATPHNNFYC